MSQLPWTAKILTAIFICALILDGTLLLSTRTTPAQAQVPLGVGGIFAPGLFDIYTPSLCGALVSVIGPKPGVFVFAAYPYQYFAELPYHVSLNTKGLAEFTPGDPCPPTLIETSSSLTPGYTD